MASELIYRRNRRAQTAVESKRFKDELTHWFAQFTDAKFNARHGRQLRLLQTTLESALYALDGNLRGLILNQPTTDLYRACRIHEFRLLWLRGLWLYFKPKFEQHCNSSPEELRKLLAAADEVVWACYSTAFVAAGREIPPAPLPYLESVFTARAVPLDEPPPELKSVDAEFLNKFLARLPIAVVGLPVSCLSAPWGLAHAAHEVGHHVQHELNLVTAFELALANAAPDESLGESWMLWGQEIFADAFGLLSLGPAAVRGLAEFELGAASLIKDFPRYPSPLVRLEWQRQALQQLLKNASLDPLGPAVEAQFQTLIPQLAGNNQRAYENAGRLAQAVLSHSFDDYDKTLSELTSWVPATFESGGDVAGYAYKLPRLRKGDMLAEPKSTITIRHLIAAGVMAWNDTLSKEEDDVREAEQKKLSPALIQNLIAHAPPGERGIDAAGESDAPALGQELYGILIEQTKEGVPA